MSNVIYILIILLIVAIIYKKSQSKFEKSNAISDNNLHISNFFLGNMSIENIGYLTKPILWIHCPIEYNTRNWNSFGSRSSYELNQPYLYLTTKSIIQHCKDSFQIVIFDDTSFSKIIPNWSFTELPLTCAARFSGFLQLLYIYGGLITPISFVCLKDLITLYYKGIRNNKMFVCENVNDNTTHNSVFVPDYHFIGAPKSNYYINSLYNFVTHDILPDKTYNNNITGKIEEYLNNLIINHNINLISGFDTGVMTIKETPIYIDDLLSSNYLNIDNSSIYGIWIPARHILSRTKFQWFARLSEEQIINSNIILCKYIVLSNIPANSYTPINPKLLQSSDKITSDTTIISFWITPLLNNLFGLKPLYLGNYVPSAVIDNNK
jgi:hypothetical protein